MAIQWSTAIRNDWLDRIEAIVGVSAVLKIRTGAKPATCATADSGTVLASATLPSDWMSAAASGSKAKLGTWSDAAADAAGIPGHFRLYASDGTTCHMQGTVTETGLGGDMTIDSSPMIAGVLTTILSFTLSAGGG